MAEINIERAYIEVQITLTDEQVINGIDINYIFWAMMNEYGMVYRMMQGRNIITIYFPGDTTARRMREVQLFVQGLLERYDEASTGVEKHVLVEIINCYERKAAINQAIADNSIPDLTVRYLPTATGVLEDGTYVNQQRWYFSRMLTPTEQTIIEAAIQTPLQWRSFSLSTPPTPR